MAALGQSAAPVRSADAVVASAEQGGRAQGFGAQFVMKIKVSY
ncbi:hypothetical protein RA2_02962 [Roseovarius sp. A-2]|nr:hypothetical protein RA2_02962 [Roseovarius sp. A-2]